MTSQAGIERKALLAGGQMRSGAIRDYVLAVIGSHPPGEFKIDEAYVSKTGSLILVLLYISGTDMNLKKAGEYKQAV